MNNLAFWNAIVQHLDGGSALMLYVVAASKKGSPGNPGFAMAVIHEGSTEVVLGTIGGGVMERNLIAEAAESLRADVAIRQIRTLHHYTGKSSGREDYTTSSSGLICAGSQTIMACRLAPIDIETAHQIRNAIAENIPLVMQLSQKGISVRTADSTTIIHTARFTLDYFTIQNDTYGAWLYEQILGAPDTVIIAGGGHVGLALSRQMALLDWNVVITDDRENTHTMMQNTFAHERITQPYTLLGDLVARQIHSGRRTFVVVVTTAYKSDVAALCSLAQLQAQSEYIGLMGSRAKIATIMREAEEAGVSAEWLKTVRAPIGVPINSDTPEEIAVSIAAEIIGAKNAQ